MRSNYLWYQFLRYGVVRPSLRMFYSDITVSGSQHIPRDKPVLFVGNHQNSFLDALHLVTNTQLFVHFLTRAEAFENPVMARFYRSLNMLPVYRIRDGFSSVQNNEAIFEQCFQELKNDDAVLIFAEASHALQRRIRPLSKGFTRIAFGAEQKFDWQFDLQIVPVGVSYGAHRKSQTPVHINFGESIAVSEYRDQFAADEREAAHQLKQETAAVLQSLTMHVANRNHYPVHQVLLDDLEPNRELVLDPNKANERVEVVEENVREEWLMKAKELYEEVESLDIELHEITRPTNYEVKDLLLSPLYLFSLVNNALPYQVVRWMTQQYLDDHVFDASVKYVVGLVLLPVFYLVISTVLGFVGISWPILLGYVLLSVGTAPLFVRAKDLLLGDVESKLEKEHPEVYQSIQSKIKYFKEIRDELF